MRQHAVVFIDVERHEPTDRRRAVKRVQEEPLMFERPPPRLDHGVRELQLREGQHTVQDPGRDQFVDLGIHVSTPASANTTGAVSEGVAARLPSSNTATLLTGANVSATRHAKIRREKLSITACR